jgi:hypothetical protein
MVWSLLLRVQQDSMIDLEIGYDGEEDALTEQFIQAQIPDKYFCRDV